jgi:hypothetical protein
MRSLINDLKSKFNLLTQNTDQTTRLVQKLQETKLDLSSFLE